MQIFLCVVQAVCLITIDNIDYANVTVHGLLDEQGNPSGPLEVPLFTTVVDPRWPQWNWTNNGAVILAKSSGPYHAPKIIGHMVLTTVPNNIYNKHVLIQNHCEYISLVNPPTTSPTNNCLTNDSSPDIPRMPIVAETTEGLTCSLHKTYPVPPYVEWTILGQTHLVMTYVEPEKHYYMLKEPLLANVTGALSWSTVPRPPPGTRVVCKMLLLDKFIQASSTIRPRARVEGSLVHRYNGLGGLEVLVMVIIEAVVMLVMALSVFVYFPRFIRRLTNRPPPPSTIQHLSDPGGPLGLVRARRPEPDV